MMSAIEVRIDMARLLVMGMFCMSATSLLSSPPRSKAASLRDIEIIIDDYIANQPLNLLIDPRGETEEIIIHFLEDDMECDCDEDCLEREWDSDTIFVTRYPEDFDPILGLIITDK
jgi:hypothetical protein